jgi:hypothetical protein
MNAHIPTIFRRAIGEWSTQPLDLPMWYYISIFGFEFALVANITPLSDEDWGGILGPMEDAPQKHARYRPVGLHYTRPPPDGYPATERRTRLTLPLKFDVAGSRNSLCKCGSGRRYKHCHGKPG